MSFFSNLFRPQSPLKPVVHIPTDANANEKQLAFIQESLKPLLKSHGYRTAGNKWWRINEPYFNVLTLQNFSWNLRNSVDFCFNFTTGLTIDIRTSDHPTIHDGIPFIRENYFGVTKNDYWKGVNGYHIDNETELSKFTEQVLSDFELIILPKFNLLTNENSIMSFYSDDFWGPRVKQSLENSTKKV